MPDWRFTILDRNNTATIIDEPSGWDKNRSEVKRDLDWHGVFFSNQGETFEFRRVAMKLIRNEYEQYGSFGQMTLILEENCGNGYEEFDRGALMFKDYDFNCDDGDCYVTIPVESANEVVDLRARINQKVDLEASKAFDETTILPAYNKLPFDLTLPSKGIVLKDRAIWVNAKEITSSLDEVGPGEHDTSPLPGQVNYAYFNICPQFDKTELSEIGRFSVDVEPTIRYVCPAKFLDATACSTVYRVEPGSSTLHPVLFEWSEITPLLVNENNSNNFDAVSKFDLSVNFAGQVELLNCDFITFYIIVVIRRADGITYDYLDRIQVVNAGYTSSNFPAPGTYWENGTTHTFSHSNSYTDVVLNDGDYLFYTICGSNKFNYTWIGENRDAFKIKFTSGSVEAKSLSKTAPTVSKMFAINEVISRVTESITNNGIKAYSEYYGRTDSQPYSHAQDGIGSLRVITDGLRLRRQENKTPGKTSVFAVSLQDVFEGLNPIDNIGIGLEADTNRAGYNRLRIEPWKHFYNDTVVLSCIGINKIKKKVYNKDWFSTFQVGYQKWEAEEYNGLDEFLTKRTFRTSLRNLKNDLVKLSKWIASGYAKEVTSRKGNEDSKDWRYDKDTFIFCCKRDGSDLVIELGNITTPENIIDPDTIYNFRISPERNAMRWMNRVLMTYKQFNSDSKIIFTDGDGNPFAKGEMTSTFGKLENQAIAENQTIDASLFADVSDVQPFAKAERITYDFPMTSKEFKQVKANPYGQIYYESDCESGYGWIDTVTYKPEEGNASFNLIPKK